MISEALADWRRKRARQDQEIEEIPEWWREGVESGKGQYSHIKTSRGPRMIAWVRTTKPVKGFLIEDLPDQV